MTQNDQLHISYKCIFIRYFSFVYFQTCKVLWEWSRSNDDEKKQTVARREIQEGQTEEDIRVELSPIKLQLSSDNSILDIRDISCDEIA